MKEIRKGALGTPQNTIDIIKKHQFAFQKKFGQNFLIDTHVLDKIIQAAEITDRDCVLEMYEARKGVKSREELIALMDKNIWISPSQAMEYGLIDEIVGLEEPEAEDPAAFVAAAGGRIRLTAAMRRKYQDHVAEEREASKRMDEAMRAYARIKALASY